ncbi:MAG: helix-turn-helix domain-containing protein [Deltaproteobacteria bacterium]|nr:MAG: helix-turn-helix domain-containing protein [Deltaproteobacteria bacterium]
MSHSASSEVIEALLRVEDLVKILNVSPSCIRELARKGELKAVKFTSDWRFKPSAVKEFIDGKEYNGYQAHKNRLAG